ncbi:MAG: SDR family oxidoreductase [Phycisphaerae bacterium]
MANVLVTGGAGFIGSHLAVRLVELGHHVRVFDNFSTGKWSNLDAVADRIELHEADLRHPEECLRACLGIDFVFHQGAIPSVPKSVEHPQDSHDVNVTGTFNMLRAAVHHKVHRFIYAASSSAYGDTPESPKHERIVPSPLSPYAVQKLAGETYALAFHACYGLETISLRYFNVFGPRQDPKSEYAAAIPAFVTALLAGRPPTVYGDGEQTRDFTYIDNVVHANMLAMNADKTQGEVVNAACGDQITVNRVIAAINRSLGTDVQPEHVPPRTGDVRHSCADITRAKALLGFSSVVPFEEGLSRAIDYYRSIADTA